MKFYLSSYKLGDEIGQLKRLIPIGNHRVAYISNALDFSNDLEHRRQSEQDGLKQLEAVGLEPEVLDLRSYFNQQDLLAKKLTNFGVIWVRGGNVFVLRQDMKLSGLDNILKKWASSNYPILYGGYSAGVCVLGPTLRGMELVDDINVRPYGSKTKIVWEGLGIINYVIVPHYKSKYPESKNVDKTIRYLIDNKILFKAIRDGEVIIE